MSSEPIFNDGRGTVTVMDITTGDQPFSLQKGCDFVVSRYLQIKPNEIYWLELKNGTTKKIFQNKTQLEKFSNVESNEITYKFQNLTRQSVFEEQGVYQCVVNFAGLDGPIVGRTFIVNIKGIKLFLFNCSISLTFAQNIMI